jgi:hypothetical protein
MPLNYNGIAIETVNFNGERKAKVNFNGTRVWAGKQIVHWYNSWVLPMTRTEGSTSWPGDGPGPGGFLIHAQTTKALENDFITYWTVDAIDLTPWDAITFTVEWGAAYNKDGDLECGDNYFIGFASNSHGYGLSNFPKRVDLNPSVKEEVNTKRTFTLDISDLKGSYHVGVAIGAHHSNKNLNCGLIDSIVIS